MKAFIAKGRVLKCPIVACLISENNYSIHDFNDSVQVNDVFIDISDESMNKVEFVFVSNNFDSDSIDYFNNEHSSISMHLTHGQSDSFYHVEIGGSVVNDFNKETLAYFETVLENNREKYSQDIEDECEDMYNDRRECESTGN